MASPSNPSLRRYGLALALAIGLAALPGPAFASESRLPYDLVATDGTALAAHAPGDETVDPALAAAPAETLPSETLEPTPAPTEDSRRWSRDYLALAAGVVTSPDYQGSADNRLLPGLYLRGRLKGFSFSTRGTNLQVDLIRQRRGQRTDFKFGPILNLRSDRTGSVDDPAVNALPDRKLAFEAGLSAGVTHSGIFTSQYDQIGFRIVGLKDVSGRHGSWVVSPTIEYGSPLSKRAYLGISASFNLYGKGFGRYYYDIDPAGSIASGLPVYSRAGTKATLGKYTIGAAGGWSLSGDLRKGFVLIGGAQYGRITSRFAASPIVRDRGDADQWIAGGGIAYNF